MSLTQQQINNLKQQGFTEIEINQAMRELEQEELRKSSTSVQDRKANDPRKFSQHSSFASKPSDDLIRLQLQMDDILERAEHILRGDVVKFKDGQLIWGKNPNPKDNTLNEFGVQILLKILSSYLNRNTILSDYDDDEVRIKVFDFGRDINNLIFMKYEEMGMDTENKRKEYVMIVRQMVDIVHSAYGRAKDGGERRSLREMINVQQTHSSMAQGGLTVNPTGQPSRSRGILNPMRYVAGKYV